MAIILFHPNAEALELPTLESEPLISLLAPSKVKEKPSPPKQNYYTVKLGDTLTSIAKAHRTSWKRIYYANRKIPHPDQIKAGMRLRIPHKGEKLKSRRIPKAAIINTATPPAQRVSSPHISGGYSNSNTYEPGQCTYWVASHTYVPNGWGDASNWKSSALAVGWTVSTTPKPGSIAWRWGHVAYVVSVGNGTVTISEQNYDWNSGIRTITIPDNQYEYIYQ